MTERCTLDGFVITPIEPQGSLYAGTDHGRLFINEARTGVMAWWSMGRWTDQAAREAIIAHAMTMTLADFRRWFARHKPDRAAGARGQVVLLADCFTAYNEPAIGRSAVRVLERAGYGVELSYEVTGSEPAEFWLITVMPEE